MESDTTCRGCKKTFMRLMGKMLSVSHSILIQNFQKKTEIKRGGKNKLKGLLNPKQKKKMKMKPKEKDLQNKELDYQKLKRKRKMKQKE